MSATRRTLAAVIAVTLALSACSDSNDPTPPEPITGITVVARSSSSVQLSFLSRAGDLSYDIERAEGAGAFAAVTTVTAPPTPGTITHTDNNLKVSTQYRYRVFANRDGLRSAASVDAPVTTLAFGNASATINDDITANRTLFADTVYTLSGFIHVGNGATLTIQPGTRVQGDFSVLGSSLIILRGARIQAVGTATNPIVFTSSRSAGQRQPGDWGGLVIVGNAPINRTGTINIEGTGTDGTTIIGGKNYSVAYSGGSVAGDNSGTLSYVRIEFAGYGPLQDQELNSVTFAAVGSGTRASFMQTMGGLDDSYEWFGGGFDADHLIAFETGDDMFDMSEGFSGRIQHVIGINTTQITPRTGAGSFATDIQGIENDGCNGAGCTNGQSTTPFTVPLVANFTLIGCGQASCSGSGGGFGMMLRRGTGGYYVNGVVARWSSAGMSVRDQATYDRAGATATPSTAADLQVRSVLFAETNGLTFQAPSASQFSFDLAANGLTQSSATAAALFTTLPAVGTAPSSIDGFDFTPATGSAIATGGLSTFSGAIQAKASGFVTGTSYLGAVAPGGPKWWTGWTSYARN
jgi:hypothetical protein